MFSLHMTRPIYGFFPSSTLTYLCYNDYVTDTDNVPHVLSYQLDSSLMGFSLRTCIIYFVCINHLRLFGFNVGQDRQQNDTRHQRCCAPDPQS